MQLLSCWISYLTFVATVIDEMFQNYEFKLVDGKCCPECVEGAHQFQVLPPLYFSLSIFSIFVLITYNECKSYHLSYIFCKSNMLYIFDGVFLAESLSSMQTGRFSLKNSKELRSVFATYCLTITTVVFRSLSTPSLVLPWSVLFGEKERSCMNWFAVRSQAILESLLSHARRLSAVKKANLAECYTSKLRLPPRHRLPYRMDRAQHAQFPPDLNCCFPTLHGALNTIGTSVHAFQVIQWRNESGRSVVLTHRVYIRERASSASLYNTEALYFMISCISLNWSVRQINSLSGVINWWVRQQKTVVTRRSGLRSTSTSTSGYSKPRQGTKFAERPFSFSGPAEWNCLPNDLRMITDTNVFKRKLKAYFLGSTP